MRDAALLAGRALVVLQLLPNGIGKLRTFAETAAGMGGAPPQMIDGRLFPMHPPLVTFPFPEFFLGASIAFDLLGTLAVLAGWHTRAVAAALAGYVLTAMTIYHWPTDGRELIALLRNLPFLGGLLLVAGAGAGRWSLDARKA